MTKKEPLLSICIPTYNREKYLKRLLDSIVCQKEFTDTDDVEIVVDDGPSTDNTETMVKDYIKKYGDKIKYYRNPVRIGMCPAFLEALDYGTGKYLRLMGSDDALNILALETIFSIINTNNPSIILSKRSSDVGYKTVDNDDISIKYVYGFTNFLASIQNENNKQDIDVFFTFISVWCLEKKYYKNALDLLIKEYGENLLKQHYFNFSFIGFSNLFGKDIISIVENPRLVQVNSFNVGRKPNMKIGNDLRQEMKFFIKKYSLNRSQNKILINIYRPWLIMCILYPIKKLLSNIGLEKLYDKASYLYRKVRGYI